MDYQASGLRTDSPAPIKQMPVEDLVRLYASLVKRIALHLSSKMPTHVTLEDLIQSGMIGLIEASHKFDASKGASFETYAGIRIRGAMLDEVRKGDWAPRSVHKNVRQITEAIRQLSQQLGRDATEIEIAQALGLSLEAYQSQLKDALSVRLFSLNVTHNEDGIEVIDRIAGDSESPCDHLEISNFRQALAAAIEALPERERLILSLYYEQEMNLKEIGQILGVSESRVCQLHSQAALRLKSRLGEW